jgi:cytochrome c5
MKKLTIVLAVSLAAALAGCGRQDNAGSAASSGSGAGTAASSGSTGSGGTTASSGSTGGGAGMTGTSGAADTVNTAGASAGAATNNTAAMGAAAAGQDTYNKACMMCHGAGVAGAPRIGDKADWQPRIAQGNDKLYEHAIKGYTGKKGVMPPKGGNTAIPDGDVKAAVDFMVAGSK